MPPSADLTLELDLQIACDPAPGLPSQAQLQSWAEAALRGRRNDAELSIRLVDEAESQTLNRDYRGKDKPTNVLSFGYGDVPELLGDLVFCGPVVAEEAMAQGKPPLPHWAHLTTHGLLHLSGYDHELSSDAEIMEAEEIAILATLGIPNPYNETQHAA